MCVLDREYEFFITTDEPQQPDGVRRGLIRRLVMRNFIETRSVGSGNNISEQNSAKTIQAKTQLKSRFRLSKAGQQGYETTSRRRKSKEESNTGVVNRPSNKRIITVEANGIEGIEQEIGVDRSLSGQSMDVDLVMKSSRKRQDQSIVLKINPSSHRFDPFDVLPIPGTRKLDMLFKLCTSRSRYFR